MASERASAPTRGDDDTPGGAATASRVPESLAVAAAWSWRLLLVAAALLVVALALARLRLVVLPVIIALLLATALWPLAARLRRRGWPPILAAWATFAGALVALGLLLTALTFRVLAAADDLELNLGSGLDEVERWLTDGPLGLPADSVASLRDRASEGSGAGAVDPVGGATLVIELVGGLLLALVLLFFVLKDGPSMWRWSVKRLPEQSRERVESMGERVWDVLGAFIRGTAVVGLIDATLMAIVLVALGVPLVLPLAVLTFFGAFIPFVGATAAGAAATLVALSDGGVVRAAIVAGAAVIIQQVDGDVVQPLVLGRAVRLHPVVILLGVTAGWAIAGIPGAFLAVPIVAATYAVLSDPGAAATEE